MEARRGWGSPPARIHEGYQGEKPTKMAARALFCQFLEADVSRGARASHSGPWSETVVRMSTVCRHMG